MKNLLKRGIQSVAWLLPLLMTLNCVENKGDRLPVIGLVQIVENPVLDSARRGVIEALRLEGFIDGKNIRIEYANAQGDIPNITMIINNFMALKADMIVTISTPCMVAAAQLVREVPVVFAVAFSPKQVGISDPPLNLTGVYDPLEMQSFVRFIQSQLPDLKKIGILFNPSEANSRFGASRLGEQCSRDGIELVELAVYSSNDVMQAAETLAYKKVDVFAVVADNTVHAAMSSVAMVAKEHKIPLFVTATSQVKDGACAGIGIDYHEWGRQSGRTAAAILKGKKPVELPIQPITAEVLYLNPQAAADQGLVFSPETLAAADSLF